MNDAVHTKLGAAARFRRRIYGGSGCARWFVLLGVIAACLATGHAHAGRWALAVGVDAHPQSPRPGTARANATGVAVALRTAGYQVHELKDPDGVALHEALSRLVASVAADDEVIVYFAGLTAEAQGDAYLLARDTPTDTGAHVRRSGQSVQAMLGALALGRPRTALLIVDGSRAPLVGPKIGQPTPGGKPWTPELEPGQAVLMAAPADRATPKAALQTGAGADGLLAHELIATLRIRVLPISRFVDAMVNAAQQSLTARSPPGTRGVLKDRSGSEYQLLGQARSAAGVTMPDTPAARRVMSEAMRTNAGSQELKVAYRTALRLAPDHLPALVGLGMQAEAESNWLTAINYFERVALMAKAGALATAAAEEARLLRRRLEAEAEPKMLRRLEYDEAIAQARLLLAMSDIAGSVGRVERALALDASRWESYAVAGEIAITLDRLQDAKRWLREAHDRAPATVRERIARLSRRL